MSNFGLPSITLPPDFLQPGEIKEVSAEFKLRHYLNRIASIKDGVAILLIPEFIFENIKNKLPDKMKILSAEDQAYYAPILDLI